MMDFGPEFRKTRQIRRQHHLCSRCSDGVRNHGCGAGGIDDIGFTSADDIEKAKNYVAAALDAALAGEEIEHQTTKPYGCSLKYAEKEKMKNSFGFQVLGMSPSRD